MASPFGTGGGGGGVFGGTDGTIGNTSNPFGSFGAASSSFGANLSASATTTTTSTSPWSTTTGSTSAFGTGASVFGGSATTSAFRSSPFRNNSAAPTFGFPAQPSTSTSESTPPSASAAADASNLNIPAPPKNPNQISSLEVLGEDSDARKQRFESSLANNRYLELKPLREAQRLRDIKNGLIPDPLKPMRLDQATDFLGTCEDMCPEWEREEREYQNNVDQLERYPGTNRIDPSRAVKAFHRPAAGNEQPLPSDVRPPRVLKTTLDYLFHDLLPTAPLHVTHPFLRDRTRSVRQDLTMQNIRGEAAIECNERIARYHVLALGTLREQSTFSESQELEQLRKVLKSLNEFYDDARFADPPIAAPNEAEFRAYNVLTHLRDPDIIWSCELLPPRIFDDHRLQVALRLHSLAQRSNLPRGERASLNAASRFFKFLAREEVPYLFGCILSTHFNDIRKNALESMKNAYMQQHSLFPSRTLVKILGCDDEAEVESICDQLGFVTRIADDGKTSVVELHKAAVMKSVTLKSRVSKRLVEAKRAKTTYQEVIDGADYVSGSVSAIPSTPSLSAPTAFLQQPSSAAPAHSRPAMVAPIPTLAAPPTAFGVSSANTFSSSSSIFTQQTSSPFANGAQSAIPTPVPTPPPVSDSVKSLNPVASAFIPSFETFPTSSATPAPPSNPFASMIPSRFASNSSKSNFDQAPKPSLPPIKKLEEKLVPPVSRPTTVSRPSPAPLQPVASTSISNTVPAPVRPKSPIISKPSPPRKPDRSALIQSLTTKLSLELFDAATESIARRTAEEVLQEHWLKVASYEHHVLEELARSTRDHLVEDFVGQEVRKEILHATRERRIERKVWKEWRRRTRESLDRKEAERIRKRRFEEDVQDLEDVGESAGDWDEDAIMEGDAFDLSKLSLFVEDNEATFGHKNLVDESFSDRIRKAELQRDQLWKSGTLLDILAEQVDLAVSLESDRRQSWSAIVSTSSRASSFATWLSCKLGLADRTAAIDTPNADISIELTTDEQDLSQGFLDNTGLILLDCTEEVRDETIHLARERLRRIVDAADEFSRFTPSLIITCCPASNLSGEAEIGLREELAQGLHIGSLDGKVARTSFWLARLSNAEDQFRSIAQSSLSRLSVRPDRVARPLNDFVAPLARVWTESVSTAFSTPARSDLSGLCNCFLSALNSIIASANDTASSRDAGHIELFPPLSNSSGSFRSKIINYSRDERVWSAGPFTLLETTLSEQPPVGDGKLARLMFEQLISHVITQSQDLLIRRGVFEVEFPRTLARLEEELAETPTFEDAKKLTKENVAPSTGLSSSPKKGKRKASSSPEVSVGKNKKAIIGVNGSSQVKGDKLSALELIMREAKGLLESRPASVE